MGSFSFKYKKQEPFCVYFRMYNWTSKQYSVYLCINAPLQYEQHMVFETCVLFKLIKTHFPVFVATLPKLHPSEALPRVNPRKSCRGGNRVDGHFAAGRIPPQCIQHHAPRVRQPPPLFCQYWKHAVNQCETFGDTWICAIVHIPLDRVL